MKRNKVAKLMVVAALVGAIGIGGSLALLTARSEAVYRELFKCAIKVALLESIEERICLFSV